LLRIRGRLVASWQPTVVNGGAAPTSNGGRKLVWDDRPPAWATTEPDHGPYVLRAVAELALKGADVSGCNIPGAAEVAARNLEANRLASNDVQSTGPWLDERDAPKSESRLFVSINGEITWHEAPTNLSPGIARYRVELEERKRFGRERAWVSGMPMHVDQGRRAKTSEYRNEQGEYGAEVKVSHDGRVYFGKKGSPLMSHSATESGLKSSTTRRDVRLADGTTKRLEAQKSPTKRKPGPKPKYGFMMSPRLRKVKERCEKRGVPFIIEHHLNAASGLSPPANSRADAVSPSVSAHFYLEDENDTNRASRDGS
jgi:hypothetical protein